ncbi:MAG TPA: response regulator transcription factor [Acidimicrobiales bacterium]|nr:response regulator transcription factor [Acidimicrobiales bacterium]
MSEARAGERDLRVLVADDEPDVRLLLRLGLRHHRIEVVGEAADGEEVVRLCAQDPPDAVVLDLLMPRMTGFEVIPILQRDHPHVGIVAYTAVAGDFVRREMARLGIRLLLKSGDSGPLARALHEAAEQARADA